MRRLLIVLLVTAACGKGGSGWECKVDADCSDPLRCGLIEVADGSRRTMCVNPEGVLDPTQTPKSYRDYALPIGLGAVVLVALLMLRSSMKARSKRKRARSAGEA